MNIIKGNIIDLAPQFDVLIHGCNCFHKMGAGVAKDIATKYPQALTVDKKTIYGERKKLGTYSFVIIDNLIIVNAYTQYYYGRQHQKNIDYQAVRNVFRKIKIEFFDKRICYPKIGSGLAGGDWNVISKIIDEELNGLDHTLIEYEGEHYGN